MLVAGAVLPQKPNTPIKNAETSIKTEANTAKTKTTPTSLSTPTPSQREKRTADKAASDCLFSAATNLPLGQAVSAIRAPVVDTPGYAFRVECKGGRYGYGKKNADCGRVCYHNKSVVLYSSERGENTVSIDKGDIIKNGVYDMHGNKDR